ncbi:HVO_A0114 family putative DNA-binding protein [Halorussus salinisoli]|uniref:HVO_A0114 family putative DNA-binding protein n=1 Tax=Halorussus salinisoli TaxID=2558242 RepID=UPI002A920A94|nr:ArsR family transcriptional regulator [Halorussus salinisoli]
MPSHESAERVLTPKRRELVTVLTDETAESVRDLARRVERDKGRVSRDLKVLAEHGVVDFEEAGKEKRPYLQHKHAVVELIYRLAPASPRNVGRPDVFVALIQVVRREGDADHEPGDDR